MHNHRIPPALIPITAFFAAEIIYAAARGTLTLKGLIIGLFAAALIAFAVTQTNRGPYI